MRYRCPGWSAPGGRNTRGPVSRDRTRDVRHRPALAGRDGVAGGDVQPPRQRGSGSPAGAAGGGHRGNGRPGRGAGRGTLSGPDRHRPGGERAGRLRPPLPRRAGRLGRRASRGSGPRCRTKSSPSRCARSRAIPQCRSGSTSISTERRRTSCRRTAAQRFGFLYDPAAGMVRLTREMRTRIDIPDADTFTPATRDAATDGRGEPPRAGTAR